MSERHSNVLQYFISPKANGNSDGTLDRPFHTLTDAVEAVKRHQAQFATRDMPESTRRTYEIVCVSKPGGAEASAARQRHRYYVDVHGGNARGNGTEMSPWINVEAAADYLRKRYESGALALKPGEKLVVAQRQVFTATDLEGKKAVKERIIKSIFMLMAFSLVVPVVLILGDLLIKAWPALRIGLLLENPTDGMTAGGLWAPLVGTFMLVMMSLLIAAPIGVLAGVYLNEYAGDNWFTRIVNLAVVNLAGVPSIVHGLFGVGAFVYFLKMGSSLLAASCTVAVMTLPVIITSTKEALAAVPQSFREACWNLGASKWQTIRTIVLPNSISGILTGVILQVARAAGETAPILFTGVVFFMRTPEEGIERFFPFGLNDKFMALSNHLFELARSVKNAPEELLYGTAVVLIGLVLIVNSLSIVVRVYLRSHKKW